MYITILSNRHGTIATLCCKHMLFKRKKLSFAKSHVDQFVYGATDGTISTFAVVAGAQGGGLGAKTALILGFANLIADGISMGVSSYLGEESAELVAEDFKPMKAVVKSLWTFASFIVVGALPLLVYVYKFITASSDRYDFIVSCAFAFSAFVIIGLAKGLVSRSSIFRSVIETILLGGIAAGAAYFVGVVLESAIR